MRATLTCIAIGLGMLGNACAATLQNGQLNACGKNYAIPAALQTEAVLTATASDIEKGNFELAYKYIADTLESSLSETEIYTKDIQILITHIRTAQLLESGVFNVKHTARKNSETFFHSHDTDEFSYSCEFLPPSFTKMAAASFATQRVIQQQATAKLGQLAQTIDKQSIAYEALLKNGLAMWPWELFLNGKRLGSKDSDPIFLTQWIFMRPTAGIEINTRNRATANFDVSVGIEPIGFVHYSDQTYKDWWGASLLATSTTQAGIGIGGLLRWNNYVLGMTRHESNTVGTPSSNFLFIGIELYDYANKKRGEMSQWTDVQQRKLENLSNP